MTHQSVFYPAGDGESYEAPGLRVTVKVSSEQSGTAYSLLEYELSPGLKGPALHYHERSDETFYVLEGNIRFTLNGETIDARPGDSLFVPRGTIHTFSNPLPAPARMLSLFSPGGFEGYFAEYAAAKAAGAGHDVFEKIRKKYDNNHL